MGLSKNKKTDPKTLMPLTEEEKHITSDADRFLGGRVSTGRDKDTGEIITIADGDRDYAAEVAKIPENKRLEIVPMTGLSGITKDITIDRRGTTEEKLGMILSDPNRSEEQKLSQLSLFLFEKGRENASFIVDLMVHKGTQTRELRQFQSTMRFDFSMFLASFCEFLESTAESIIQCNLPEENAYDLEKKALEFMRENEGSSIKDFIRRKLVKNNTYDNYFISLIDLAIRFISEAQLMQKKMENLTEEREEARGKGVHLGVDGKPTKGMPGSKGDFIGKNWKGT